MNHRPNTSITTGRNSSNTKDATIVMSGIEKLQISGNCRSPLLFDLAVRVAGEHQRARRLRERDAERRLRLRRERVEVRHLHRDRSLARARRRRNATRAGRASRAGSRTACRDSAGAAAIVRNQVPLREAGHLVVLLIVEARVALRVGLAGAGRQQAEVDRAEVARMLRLALRRDQRIQREHRFAGQARRASRRRRPRRRSFPATDRGTTPAAAARP